MEPRSVAQSLLRYQQSMTQTPHRLQTTSGLFPKRAHLLVSGVLAWLFVGSQPAPAQIRIHLPHRSSSRISSQSLRRRLHINSLITEPGTFELESGGAYSVSGAYFLPTALKITPSANTGFWGRTELSANFDMVSSSVEEGRRTTQFSDHVSVAATTVVYGGEKINVALAPMASFFLRGDRGARLGAAAVARVDAGLSSAGVSVSWTGATASSSSNPAGIFDLGGGFGRRLASSGTWARITPHGNAVYERLTGAASETSVFAGVEYQLTQKLAFDISSQHLNLGSASSDHQILLGITWNFGPPRTWFSRSSGRLGSPSFRQSTR
jgi:hypothetical protein